MPLIEEPRPRTPPITWEPFTPEVSEWRYPDIPEPPAPRDFGQVLRSRRSTVGAPVSFDAVAALLWHAAGTKGHAPAGRAGIPIEWRASPSSGGLHAIQVICIGPPPADRAILYDPIHHGFGDLKGPPQTAFVEHAAQLKTLVGRAPGWTLRLIGDFSKIGAAYENAESLLLRDSGCLIATICLCAEWLGLHACPLGFLGQTLCAPLGFPPDRFFAVGGVHLTA